MKVFWSWQSDHAGKISRHFVRTALEEAIKQLNEDPEIEDAERPEQEIELDHDRKGVPGTPDLAPLIFNKIRLSDAFVADVTPVGATFATPTKALINSNVAIELGFAFNSITDRRVVIVMNEHYGSPKDLPFDLSHKSWPITYRLDPNATSKEITLAGKALSENLKGALRLIVADLVKMPKSTPFEPMPANSDNSSRYFPHGLPLATIKGRVPHISDKAFFVPDTPLLYLRLIPTKSMPRLQRAETLELSQQGPVQLVPFWHNGGSMHFAPNEHGAISFDGNYEAGEIFAAAQLFCNREIWAFNSYYLNAQHGDTKGIFTRDVEETFARRLRQYIDFSTTKLGVEFPLRIEAGAIGVKGYVLFMPDSYARNQWGPIQTDTVVFRKELNAGDAKSVERLLLGIFQEFFDAAGIRRPKGLHSFPED